MGTQKTNTMVVLKCLTEGQMKFIQDNHLRKTARQMADALQIEHHKVTLFCQANGIEPFQDRITILRKNKDSFHNIPHERKLRMARQKYNGPKNYNP